MSFCACFCVLFSGFEANIFFLVLQFHAPQSNYMGKAEIWNFSTSLQLDISQTMLRRKIVKMLNFGKEIENDEK